LRIFELMKPFDHYSPESLSEAIELIARFDGKGHVIAGGTDLNLKMKAGTLAPDALINIKRLSELKGISYEEDKGLEIGALTTLRELTRSDIIQDRYPSLAYAASLMASEQIRSFATLGGNLCNAAPSADLAPPLIAFRGEARIVGSSGEHTIPLEDFFLGPGSTALKPGELLMQINLPPPVGKTVFLKHSPRVYMDISVVCVGLQLFAVDGVCRQERIVLGAVAPVPLRARRAEAELGGKMLTPGNISKAAQIAAEECSPIDDVRGSAWYRRRMVEVLTRRGLNLLVANTGQV
jgi:carbon-monoxide dehydrogenase medium subunit